MIATFGTPMNQTADVLRLENFFSLDLQTEEFLCANQCS
jgi:hypothetical protein